MINTILEIAIIALLLVTITLLIILLTKKTTTTNKNEINELKQDLISNTSNTKNEINNQLNNIQRTINEQLNTYLNNFNVSINEKLVNLKEEVKANSIYINKYLDNMQRSINENLNTSLNNFNSSISDKLLTLTQTLKENLNKVNDSVKENTNKVENYLNTIRSTLQLELANLQSSNNLKLDEMRKTVDEKLDLTLSSRLTESFKLVQENLHKVEEGLGEMRNLATGVGDLKRVLTNVKTRGIWGEVQLANILEEILNKDQYSENVIIKPKSKDPVEFALKLPGEKSEIVYLPIDAKFPLDVYTNLIDAYETMDKDLINKALTELKTRIKKCAKDIKDKYLEPPYTTDFGIMFLPIEGLYAEVAKSGLIEELQNNYRIIIAGPTTMAALLNSLQVGFRTLAIEKRSSEVWNILAAVKSEFDNFESVLKKAQDKITQANDEIEKLVGVRTRQIKNKLKNVTALEYEDAKILIEDNEEDDK